MEQTNVMPSLIVNVNEETKSGKLRTISTFNSLDAKENLQNALNEARKNEDGVLIFVQTDKANVEGINAVLASTLYNLKPTKNDHIFVFGRIKGSGKIKVSGIIDPAMLSGIA